MTQEEKEQQLRKLEIESAAREYVNCNNFDNTLHSERQQGMYDGYVAACKFAKAYHQQTEAVNLDDLDKLFNSLIEWVDDDFNKGLFIESFNYIKNKTK